MVNVYVNWIVDHLLYWVGYVHLNWHLDRKWNMFLHRVGMGYVNFDRNWDVFFHWVWNMLVNLNWHWSIDMHFHRYGDFLLDGVRLGNVVWYFYQFFYWVVNGFIDWVRMRHWHFDWVWDVFFYWYWDVFLNRIWHGDIFYNCHCLLMFLVTNMADTSFETS